MWQLVPNEVFSAGDIVIFPDTRSSVLVDFLLRIVGGLLAAASILFAGLMIGLGPDVVSKRLVESIPDAVFRSAILTFDPARASRGRRALDFGAVGSIRDSGNSRILPEFELLDCERPGARVRTPQGRVLRVTTYSRLPAIGEIVAIVREGGRCIVSTREGRIVGR